MINVTESDIQASNITFAGSRYKNQKVLYYGDQKFITFSTYKRKKYSPNGMEKVMLINKGVEYRPDLVSYDIYGFTDNWWKILEANEMYDIFDFKAGTTILLPEV